MSDSAATTPPAARRPTAAVVAAAFLLDLALVVVFAATGRASHAEGLDPAGIWSTAWPFALGLAIVWIAALLWRAPLAVLRTGVPAWLGTVAVGMVIRALAGGGTAVAFIVVATVTLGVFLMGWRTIAALVRRLRGHSAP